MSHPLQLWQSLQNDITGCNLCPRLRSHCTTIASVKRAAFKNDTYWAKPIPNLGNPDSALLILGLAPAAHGANRTGRMFTGDRSGDFLFEAMHAAGFANQPTSLRSNDGLQLIDCVITAAAHCAPPDNKPLPEELANCRAHLDRTVSGMPRLAGVLALGGIAFEAALLLFKRRQWLLPGGLKPRFGHGAFYRFSAGPFLLSSFHPSQQNTFTGRLTQPMLRQVLRQARNELNKSSKNQTITAHALRS